MESEPSELELLFRVGKPQGVPIKIFRESGEAAPTKTLRRSDAELRCTQASIFGAVPLVESVLRLSLSTDDDGLATAVGLVQLGFNGVPLYYWRVWSAGTLSITDAPLPQGVELPAAGVELAEDTAAAAESKTEADRQRASGDDVAAGD